MAVGPWFVPVNCRSEFRCESQYHGGLVGERTERTDHTDRVLVTALRDW